MLDTSNFDALQRLKQLHETDQELAQKRLEELDATRQEVAKMKPLTPETISLIDSIDETVKFYNGLLMNAQFNLTLISHAIHKIELNLTN